MTDQVTDNRTNISTGEAATNWEDLSGAALAVDTEIRYDTYTGSIGGYVTTSRDGTIYDNGSTGLFTAGDHAYLLINCGVVSLLDTKANGGLTVRATGATLTDWAEFELFGSDEWPTTFDGGWAQIVVDIDELLANPTNTNGTPPTVGNIQRFGVTYITATVMPRMTDNIWVGGFRRLPANTPAIIVEGRDSGTTDWDWDSIRSVAAVQLSAVIKPGPGGSFVCRGPIQFGINDTTTHAFTESNKTLLWDFQEVMLDGFYGLSALGNSGFLNTTFTDAMVTGTLDGECHLDRCIIDDLTFVSGVIENCLLNPATITLGGSETAHFINCASGVPGTGTPTVSMGSGQALAFRNYNGGITIENKTGADSVSVDLNSGQLILDSTVTNGTIVVRGVGKLIDNSVGATVIDELIDGVKFGELHTRFDLDVANPNTYADDGSSIANSDFTLTKSDNGNGTFDIDRT